MVSSHKLSNLRKLMVLNYTNATLETILETQVKFKVLYSYSTIFSKNENLILKNNRNLVKIFLKLIYSIKLKKVLSGKVTNRLIINYFKKFTRDSGNVSENSLKSIKTSLDSNFMNTLAISSIYELCNTER
jgi:hypothetical protein